MKTDEEIENYLGTRDCLRNESPLAVWCAQEILLLKKRLHSLYEDTKEPIKLSEVGLGIVEMALDNKRSAVYQLVYRLEGLALRIENGKYIFDTKNYKPGTFYELFAEIVILLKTKQMAFYEYMAIHSNLEADSESMKSGVNYQKRMKGGNKDD